MGEKRFWEILEETVIRDMKSEARDERSAVQDTPTQAGGTASGAGRAYDRMQIWLSSQLNKMTFATKGYTTPAASHGSADAGAGVADDGCAPESQATAEEPSCTSEEPRLRITSAQEMLALGFLQRQGAKLGEEFSASELKHAYRTLAKRFHPDRHAGASNEIQARAHRAFMQLNECYEILYCIFR